MAEIKKLRGHVKWWHSARGYGFVTGEDGQDYFVHYSDVQGEGRKNLIPFASIEFQPEKNIKGLKATQVKLKTD